jgi:acetyl esterase/lipase
MAVEGATTHVYKSIGGIDLRLHIFTASGNASILKAAIVFFFGGAWTSGTVRQFVPQSKHLAERGMVAIVAVIFARAFRLP